MSDRDPLDTWFDEARSLLREDDPKANWPTPQTLARRSPLARPMWGVAMHVLVVVVGCSAALLGRTDPMLIPAIGLAVVATLGPYVILERATLRRAGSLTASIRHEAQAHITNAATWKLSAWALGILAVIAMVAAGLTYGRYATSSTPFLRAAPLRWSLLATSLLGLATLAVARLRGARRAAAETQAFAEELEFDDPTAVKSWSERGGARLLLGLFAFSFAGASSYLLTPDNQDDSPARVLVVGPRAPEHAAWLNEQFGLEAKGLSIDDAWESAQDRFGGEAGELETLTHYADLEGIGFVFIDLRALTVELGKREDVRLVSPNAADAAFAVLATGDVNVLAYAHAWGGQPRTRDGWVPLGPHSTSFGQAEPWLREETADRIALARALFSQPAFLQPDSDNPENPPELNGRSHTLMRGMIYFGLPADFWHDALAAYTDMESVLARGDVPAALQE